MFHIKKTSTAQSTVEYIALLLLVIVTFLLFQKYIARGMGGRWVATGDSMAYGRLYDAKKTLECVYNDEFNVWYNAACYEKNNCDCFTLKVTCGTATCNNNRNNDCGDCMRNCRTSKCN